MFNKDFFTPDHSYTREMAEQKLREKGFKNFQFSGSSFANGASFYFTSDKGEEIRVSDHKLTGKRLFDVIDIPFHEPKAFPTIKKQPSIESLTDQFKAQLRIELKGCEKGLYPLICSLKDSERGFQEIFKNVYDICSKTGMGIDSALAQYESALS